MEYRILGSDLQGVEITLDPGEEVTAESGAMSWMDPEIKFTATLGGKESGIVGSLLKAGKRKLTGESLFLSSFKNSSKKKAVVGFSSAIPGKIVSVSLASIGGVLYCQKSAYLCSTGNVDIEVALTKKLGAGFFGGEGFILEKLQGDGRVFLQAGGSLVKKELKSSKILVDTGCLVAFTQGIDYSIEKAGSVSTMLFGGEGLFLASLSGTGKLILQTLPEERLIERIGARLPSR